MSGIMEVRSALMVVILGVAAAAGMAVFVGALLMAVTFASDAGEWSDLVTGIGLWAAGYASLVWMPAVVALYLRLRRPAAAGTIAALLGALAVCVAGPSATDSGWLLAVTLGGLLLVFCSVPLPAPAEDARFGG